MPGKKDEKTARGKLYETREEAHAAYRESPARFFERYQAECFDDRDLISPDWTWYETKYHYNLVENGLIDFFRAHLESPTGNAVLDVGAGSGHWIPFYLEYMEAREVVAVDFTEVSATRLQQKFGSLPKVEVRQLDASVPVKEFKNRFEVVNAIGVMFHIVDDEKWRTAVSNILSYLKAGGIAVVGGDFGDTTESVGVWRRFRSRDLWTKTLSELGGDLLDIKRFDWFKGGVNPGLKNNLLAFRRR